MKAITNQRLLQWEQQYLIDEFSPIIKDLTNVLVRLEREPDEDDVRFAVTTLRNRISRCKKIAFSSSTYRNNIEKIIEIISSEENSNDDVS